MSGPNISFPQHHLRNQPCSLSSARGLGLGIRGTHLSPSAVALLLAAYPSDADWEDPAERKAAMAYMEQSLGAVASDAETGELCLPCLPPPQSNSRFDPREDEEASIVQDAVRIFTDMEAPARVVSRKGIQFVSTKEEADTWLWTRPITNFLELPPSLRVCQFPYEGAFVQKDLLPLAVRKYCYGKAGEPATRPSWWLPTFDLSTEFHLFQKEFERRSRGEEDNIWIIKPAIGTHGVGHSIISTLEDTVKAIQTGNGSDKVAQLFVQRPACAVPRTMSVAKEVKHKFDFRVFVVVRSFAPVPELYRHSHLYARLANKAYDETVLSDDCVQITSAGARDSYDYFAGEKPSEDLRRDDGQYRLLWDEYVAQLEEKGTKTFPTGTGELVLQDIDRMLWEVFSKIGKDVVGGPWPRSRAYYGVDVILEQNEDGSRPCPRLLEINFMADWDVALLAGIQADREEEVIHWANDLITVLATDEDLEGHPRLRRLHQHESV